MITLHQFEASPYCDKVRRVLHVKGQPYRAVEVSLLGSGKVSPTRPTRACTSTTSRFTSH